MKTRNGFVSNSSSSSFIVLFPYRPNSAEDLKELMFPKWGMNELVKADLETIPAITIGDIVSRVFSDICNGQEDRYNVDFESVFDGHIDAIDGDSTIANLMYESWSKRIAESSNPIHELGDKYGEDDWDSNKEDPLYIKYLALKKVEQEALDNWTNTRKEAVTKYYNNFIEMYKYHEFRHIFEYGDRYGEYIFEYGNIFRNLPHITVSNH